MGLAEVYPGEREQIHPSLKDASRGQNSPTGCSGHHVGATVSLQGELVRIGLGVLLCNQGAVLTKFPAPG